MISVDEAAHLWSEGVMGIRIPKVLVGFFFFFWNSKTLEEVVSISTQTISISMHLWQ
jgi:hypothetical protein